MQSSSQRNARGKEAFGRITYGGLICVVPVLAIAVLGAPLLSTPLFSSAPAWFDGFVVFDQPGNISGVSAARASGDPAAEVVVFLDNWEPAKHDGSPHGNNGVGNGEDPQPPGNPPVNDGPGTSPGNPGNKGGAKK